MLNSLSNTTELPVRVESRSIFPRLIVLLLSLVLVSGCGVFKKDKGKGKEESAEQLYKSARKSLSKKRYADAIEKLRTLEAKYPYGVYAEQAQLDTIYAYFLSEEKGLALAAADRFIKLNPAHESVDYAYYLKGLVSFEEDKSLLGQIMGKDDLSDRDASAIEDAMYAFEELDALFPDSRYAPDARKRAKYLNNALARNEMSVAKYYFSRGAYVAVVNRAKGVVENYSSTPAVEDALAIMMFSYNRMGFKDLSGDARRVLELNFPTSGYLSMNSKKVKFTDKSGSISETTTKKDKNWLAPLTNIFRKEDS